MVAFLKKTLRDTFSGIVFSSVLLPLSPNYVYSSVADPGCLMFIPDQGSKFFSFRIRIKELKYLTQKIVSKLSEI
jgi:hypothetical protein